MARFFLVLLLIAAPCGALAEDTGWITGSEWWLKSVELDRQHMLLTKVECKDSGAPGLTLKAGLVRVYYEPNTKNIGWLWTGSGNFTKTNSDILKKGYHLVSKDSFLRRKSGLRIYCLLYQK